MKNDYFTFLTQAKMMGFLLRETAENLSRDNLFTVYKLRGEKSANSSI